MKPYRTAIVGLGIHGAALLESLSKNVRFDLCGVSDKSRSKCEDIKSSFDIKTYDDSRQLILNEKPEIVILMVPNYLAHEAIQTAAGIKCNIFKKAPLARDISEAQKWMAISKKGKVTLALSCPNRTHPISKKIKDSIHDHKIGKVYLSTINYFTQFKDVLDWRGEPKLSGGGVLLEGAYDKVDLIKETLGLPNRIFAIKNDLCKKNSLPPYLTEDSFTVTMEYNDNVMANICCGWMAGTESLNISFYGTEGSIHATENSFRLLDRNNQEIENISAEADETELTVGQLENFADHLENTDLILDCNAQSFIETLAMINTAYLSTVTKSPEEPTKLLNHL